MPAPPPIHALEVAILTLLIDRYPAPVHRDEMARAFEGDDWAASASSLVVDGLMHRVCDLYLASRAAARAAELLG